jgi:phosphomethylpyrimidine synthase
MEITQQIRDYAQKLGIDENAAREKGMETMAQTFKDEGSEIYVPK